jgi:hypothetical protein
VFIGSINSSMRSILREHAAGWPEDVWVACSGNFTVERILAPMGKVLHGNDVSLYSVAIGKLLEGGGLDLKIRPGYEWMGDPSPGYRQVAMLLLAGEYMQYEGRITPYHRRMKQALIMQWEKRLEETTERVKKAVAGVLLAGFYAGDLRDHVASAPAGAAIVAFPPTYAGGYERLYRNMELAFEWEKPEYREFKPADFEEFASLVSSREHWMLSRDAPAPALEKHLRGVVQNIARAKTVYVYSSGATSKVVGPIQAIDTRLPPRLGLDDELPADGQLSLVKLTGAQMNALRSQYLSPGIVPSAPDVALGVLAGGKLIGAIGLSTPKFGGADFYLLSDFPVVSNVYRRLSKLIVAVVLSREVAAVLEQAWCRRVKTMTTTAFTAHSASMKYRGLLEVSSRKEGHVNYEGAAGRWDLKGAWEWWKSKHISS